MEIVFGQVPFSLILQFMRLHEKGKCKATTNFNQLISKSDIYKHCNVLEDDVVCDSLTLYNYNFLNPTSSNSFNSFIVVLIFHLNSKLYHPVPSDWTDLCHIDIDDQIIVPTLEKAPHTSTSLLNHFGWSMRVGT